MRERERERERVVAPFQRYFNHFMISERKT